MSANVASLARSARIHPPPSCEATVLSTPPPSPRVPRVSGSFPSSASGWGKKKSIKAFFGVFFFFHCIFLVHLSYTMPTCCFLFVPEARVLRAALILRFRFYPHEQVGICLGKGMWILIGFVPAHEVMCLWAVAWITCALIIVPSIFILQKNQSFLMSQVITEDKYRRGD